MATIQYFGKDFRSWGMVEVPVILEKDVPEIYHPWEFNVDATGKGYYHFFKSNMDDSLVAVDHCEEREHEENGGDKEWWDRIAADMVSDVSKYISKQVNT